MADGAMEQSEAQTTAAKQVAALPPAVRAGDYLCSEHELYRIEHFGEERAVVEDCRSGELIDMPLVRLLALRRVQPTASEPGSG